MDTENQNDVSAKEEATPYQTDAPPVFDAPGELSPEALQEAKRYNRLELWCSLADRALDLLFLGVMAFFLAVPVDGWLEGRLGLASDVPRLVVLFLVTFLLHEAVSLPLSFYSGHVLERQFGLSTQSGGRWFVRHLKHYLVALVISLLMFLGLYTIFWTVGPWWWLVAACAFFAVSVLAGQLMPVLILPLFYRVVRLEEPAWKERWAHLASTAGLSLEGIYRLDLSVETVKANAMLAGLGSTRRVLLGDTLLEKFTREELDVIFAHELGHHVHRHLPKILVAGGIFAVVSFWLCHRTLAAYLGESYVPYDFGVQYLPLLMLILHVVMTAFEPLQNLLSRHFERQSDRYALESTGNHAAYKSAFQKLAAVNKVDPDPHPLEVALFHSHPPISQRLAIADH